jgi:hypothetical protein
MSAVSDVIATIRYNVGDVDSTRYTAATLLSMVKQAVNRANRILQRNMIQFAKKYEDKTTTDDQAYITMPSDFDTDIYLGLTTSGYKLVKLTEAEWNANISATANSYYYLDYVNSRIWIKGTPTDSTTTIRVYYFPTVDTSAYTTATTMPWSGRIDDIIAHYVEMRLLNLAEMDVSIEIQLLQDMENQIIEAYRPLSQNLQEPEGWNNFG